MTSVALVDRSEMIDRLQAGLILEARRSAIIDVRPR
jgi:hypothetical protein